MRLKTDFKGRPPRVFKRGKTYYIRQRLYGRDVWRSLKTENRREAEEIAYRRWFSDQSLEAKDCLDLPEYPMEDAWQAYADSEAYSLLKDSTRHTVENCWKAFAAWVKARKLRLSDLSAPVLLEYLNARGKKNKTFNNIRSDLAQVFKAVEMTLGLPNPVREVKPRITSRGEKASADFRVFTDDEIRKILDGLAASSLKFAPEWIAACKISLMTGLRYKDVAKLNWSHVKRERGVLELIPHKTETKTGKAIILKLCPQLLELFDSLPRSASLYVLPGLGESYRERLSTKHFSRYLDRLDIQSTPTQRVGFHSFRSTFATRAKEAGVSDADLGGILGHSSARQTKHYNKGAEEVDLSGIGLKIG